MVATRLVVLLGALMGLSVAAAAYVIDLLTRPRDGHGGGSAA